VIDVQNDSVFLLQSTELAPVAIPAKNFKTQSLRDRDARECRYAISIVFSL
jgi:hypothetical protein